MRQEGKACVLCGFFLLGKHLNPIIYAAATAGQNSPPQQVASSSVPSWDSSIRDCENAAGKKAVQIQTVLVEALMSHILQGTFKGN